MAQLKTCYCSFAVVYSKPSEGEKKLLHNSSISLGRIMLKQFGVYEMMNDTISDEDHKVGVKGEKQWKTLLFGLCLLACGLSE